MEMKLKIKHSKQVISTLKHIEIFIQKLLDINIGQQVRKELHYIINEVSQDYVIIRMFIIVSSSKKYNIQHILQPDHPTDHPTYYPISTVQYTDFKKFLNKLHSFEVQNKLALKGLRITGLELRVKPDRLQLCDAHIYIIPKKGVKRTNNLTNVYVDRIGPNGTLNNDWAYSKTMKTFDTLRTETFPRYGSKLRVTVNTRGIWYFKRNLRGRGKIRGVRNVKNFSTFSNCIGNLNYPAARIWAKLCNVVYNMYHGEDPTTNIENILELSRLIPSELTSDINTRGDIQRTTIKIPFINTDANKIAGSFLKIAVSKKHVTKRFENTIILLIKMLLVLPEDNVIKYLIYLIDLHKIMRLKDIPIFNERIIIFYENLSQEIKYYKEDVEESEVKKSMDRIELYIITVITGDRCGYSIIENNHYQHNLRDTLEMLYRLKYQLIYPNLSINKIKSYHDKLTRDTRLLDIGDVIPDIAFYEHVIKVLSESKDYTTVLINSGKLLAEESAIQRHCVHNYASAITNGSCIIFSTYFREKRWTLEIKERFHRFVKPGVIDTNTVKEYYISQFKGFLNEDAPDELYELVRESLKAASVCTNEVPTFKLDSDYQELNVAVL